MRVISGVARGRKLSVPAGKEIRPTAERVKEALFNIIQFDVEGRRVLDLCAGSGQLGIEALSRGAASAIFVDQSREAAVVIRENLASTRLDAKAVVKTCEATTYLSSAPGSFDLILCDPPYHTELLERVIHSVVRFDILSEGGIMICEAAAGFAPPSLCGTYRTGKTYRYGSRTLFLVLHA